MGIKQTTSYNWLAETKFHPPQLLEDFTPRQRLLDSLHHAQASHPFTLIAAPAGYGKTTLLAAFLTTYRYLTVAWLSLDAEDNDPVRFLAALIAALRHLNPNFGTASQSLLTNQTNPGFDVQRVISVLINDVLDTLSNPFALILDDLHQLSEPSIFAALEYLLEHLPPQMHLVVSTRVDPPVALARMRARGQVAELRLADLRFTIKEATTFLNLRMGVDLSPEEVGSLHSWTEGWPVGLRLLGASLNRQQSMGGRSEFIQYLMKEDRYVFDFLAEEVLNLQEPAIKDFLLETAILSELTPTLCQAITGRSDAGVVLEDLLRRNIFLVAAGIHSREGSNQLIAAEPSYRYHDLFAEFLRHKLQQEQAERIPALHLRAARAESDSARAVVHYLAASRWQEAAEMIEKIGGELITRGYMETLNRWINALPASIRDSRPRLLQFLSQCAIWKGEWLKAQSLLEKALQGYEEAGDEAGQGEVLSSLAAIMDWPQSNFEQSEALLNQALAYPLPDQIRVQVLLERASHKLTWGDWAQAERDFKYAMKIQQSEGLDVLHLYSFPVLDPGFAFLPDGLEYLERINEKARAQLNDEFSLVGLVVKEMMMILQLLRGQLAEAIRIGQGALELRQRLSGHPFLAMDAAFFLLIAHAARGDYSKVDSLFELLFLGVSQTTQPAAHLVSALYIPGRIRWLQGRFNEAREIYDNMCALADADREIPADRISRAWMRSLLEMADGRYVEAERTLRQSEVLEQKDRYSTINGCTRLMLARLYNLQNMQQAALTELAPVLAYHEQLGIPYPILVEGQSIVPLLRLAVEQNLHEGYAETLLELLGEDSKLHSFDVPYNREILTPREVEVLREIAKGVSNQKIAERLVITESTVKTHAYHIFAKLDVSTRTQAAVRARELNII